MYIQNFPWVWLCQLALTEHWQVDKGTSALHMNIRFFLRAMLNLTKGLSAILNTNWKVKHCIFFELLLIFQILMKVQRICTWGYRQHPHLSSITSSSGQFMCMHTPICVCIKKSNLVQESAPTLLPPWLVLITAWHVL